VAPQNQLKIEPTVNDNVIPAVKLFGLTDLHVWGTSQNADGSMVLTLGPVNAVIRPAPLLNVKDGYGLIVADDTMSPALEVGWTVLINPTLPPIEGDLCVFRGHAMDGAVLVCIARLRRQSLEAWSVRKLNPQRDSSLKRSEWQVCHVIVGSYSGR
jgi:phage repressor protein C with HTH and peptisase S24 domain